MSRELCLQLVVAVTLVTVVWTKSVSNYEQDTSKPGPNKDCYLLSGPNAKETSLIYSKVSDKELYKRKSSAPLPDCSTESGPGLDLCWVCATEKGEVFAECPPNDDLIFEAGSNGLEVNKTQCAPPTLSAVSTTPAPVTSPPVVSTPGVGAKDTTHIRWIVLGVFVVAVVAVVAAAVIYCKKEKILRWNKSNSPGQRHGQEEML